MELEDFKNIYQRKEDSQTLRSAEELTALVKRRSTTAIEKVVRNLRMELIFGTVLCVVLSVYVFRMPGSCILPYLAGLIIVFMIIQTLVYIPIFKRIKNLHDNNESSTRVWLKSLIDYLERFIKLYIRSMVIAIPAGAVFGGVIGYNSAGRKEPDPAVPDVFNSEDPAVLIIIIIVCVLLFIGTFFFLRWAVREMYGKHLECLKAAYEELGEE
ncbi:MAG: hypothetical protein ACK4WD_11165 [Flavobacteriales bacterium]|jgi:hypothetical protein